MHWYRCPTCGQVTKCKDKHCLGDHYDLPSCEGCWKKMRGQMTIGEKVKETEK